MTLALSMVGQSKPLIHAQPSTGTILVITNRVETDEGGLLFQVDPMTGTRTILSDFNDASQGPRGSRLDSVVIEASGNILIIGVVATTGREALFRVDPTTGTRTILSDFYDASQGPRGNFPAGIAIEASGAILVTDVSAGTDERGVLFRVNPTTGIRTILSDFGDASQGPLGLAQWDVAIGKFGTILVIDVAVGTDERGALFRVNPTSGARTILSDFGDASQGSLGKDPVSVTLEVSGDILIIDGGAGTDIGGGAMMGALFRVDPTSGIRTILSDFGNVLQGPLGGYPYDRPEDVVVETSGAILVVDANTETNERGVLFRVDPITGTRIILSDFSDATQGPLGVAPWGVTVLPVLAPNTAIQWQRIYGGSNSSRAYSLVETIDGGFALAGSTSSFGCSIGLFLVKTDAYGTQEWMQNYCDLSGGANMIIQTAYGAFVIAGMGSGGTILIVKTDTFGNVIWKQEHLDYWG